MIAVLGLGGLTALLIANMGGSSDDENAQSDSDDDGGGSSQPAGPIGSTTERIETLLKDEPPLSRPAVNVAALAGSWQGRIVAMEALAGQDAAALDVETAPPLAFAIQQEGGDYVLASADGQLPSRVLESDGEKIRGQGSPALALALEGDVLIGTVTNEHWRLEFHATRQP